ncbi:hypothetical protein EV207_12553 [Scopulibacillus darangshiensis]|uniref:50S ribosomal protein L33 n=1 Tax=Scopulibacillus darangshiensis TaxID=442528 RepID=A0A4R2NRW8_9BACL|nr:hypothetical protein EV207_12553 [Scopulibacillus darangshiensis]
MPFTIHCKTCGTRSAKSYLYKKTAQNQINKGVWKRHKDNCHVIKVEKVY